MTRKQLQVCDKYVYIPQYSGGTASLNVTVAASIVMFSFASQAGFAEQPFEGHKFVREDLADPRSRPQAAFDELHAARRREKHAAARSAAEDVSLADASLFGSESGDE